MFNTAPLHEEASQPADLAHTRRTWKWQEFENAWFGGGPSVVWNASGLAVTESRETS